MNALLLALIVAQVPAQNVVVVTIDGLRPREVFTGAERANMRGVESEDGLVEKYWRNDVNARREVLMPFLWSTMAREGQVFGNTALGSPMRVTNDFRCSYPGYAELFTGFADPRINGNGYGENPNVTVLEWLNQQPGFEGEVQAFATWHTFSRILNTRRSGLDVRAGLEPPFANDVQSPTRATIDALFRTTTPLFGGNALDALTFVALRESLRTTQPRVLVLGLGEVDEWMHAGRYDLALEATRRSDAIIAELWRTLQSMDEYRDNTTLIVTTDHGRGLGKKDWRHHGEDVRGADEVWFAVMGPNVAALGERVDVGLTTQAQVAATIAQSIGFDWTAEQPRAAKPLPLSP